MQAALVHAGVWLARNGMKHQSITVADSLSSAAVLNTGRAHSCEGQHPDSQREWLENPYENQ
jgi:hypothetical protein